MFMCGKMLRYENRPESSINSPHRARGREQPASGWTEGKAIRSYFKTGGRLANVERHYVLGGGNW